MTSPKPGESVSPEAEKLTTAIAVDMAGMILLHLPWEFQRDEAERRIANRIRPLISSALEAARREAETLAVAGRRVLDRCEFEGGWRAMHALREAVESYETARPTPKAPEGAPPRRLHAETCVVPGAFHADDPRCNCGLADRVNEVFDRVAAPEGGETGEEK